MLLENMIKGLDDDEVEFLDLVDRSKLEEEKKKTEEEMREIADFRNKVASLQERSLEQRIQQELRQPSKMNNLKRYVDIVVIHQIGGLHLFTTDDRDSHSSHVLNLFNGY